MSKRDLWQKIHERFDPEEPEYEPERRANRPLSPIGAIEKALDRPFGIPHILLTGTLGTGKTTELLRIAQSRAHKEFVVVLDLVRHFRDVMGDLAALERVSSWEVCFLAGLALLRSAQQNLGFQFDKIHLQDLTNAYVRLAQASGEGQSNEPVEIDAAKLAKSMALMASATVAQAALGPAGTAVGTGLVALAGATEAGKWPISLGLGKKRLPDQDAHVQTLIRCVNVLIGLVQKRARKVLLIIDGLDRIDQFENAKALFLDSQMLGMLDCRLVVCGPFVLRRDGAIANVRGFSDVPPVVNIPVMAKDNPHAIGDGVEFFRDLYARRVPEDAKECLIPRPLLERLAYYSGGRAREFVIMIRRIADFAWDADANVVTDDLVASVIDERRRRREMGLDRRHIRLLESVVLDSSHRLPEDDAAYKLVINTSLLPYPNESEWYYPHPLLLINLVRVKTGSNQ